MSGVLDLARPELLTLRRYQPGAYEPNFIRLNANESPWRLPADTTERGLNVYPPPRPDGLAAALAAHWRLSAAQSLLVTRGSSEAIDLLIRGFCGAGRDGIFRFLADGTAERRLSVLRVEERTTEVIDKAPESFGGAVN